MHEYLGFQPQLDLMIVLEVTIDSPQAVSTNLRGLERGQRSENLLHWCDERLRTQVLVVEEMENPNCSN